MRSRIDRVHRDTGAGRGHARVDRRNAAGLWLAPSRTGGTRTPSVLTSAMKSTSGLAPDTTRAATASASRSSGSVGLVTESLVWTSDLLGGARAGGPRALAVTRDDPLGDRTPSPTGAAGAGVAVDRCSRP